MRFHFGILKSEMPDSESEWVKSCENRKDIIDYKVIDLIKTNWYETVISENFDCFLTHPSDKLELYKRLYDERLFTINQFLGKMIYPSLTENLIYENKRFLSYWLKAKGIPHPATWIFYSKEEALAFAGTAKLPLVAKTAVGSAGTGVRIFRDRASVVNYIETAFSSKGITRDWGPNLRKSNISKRIVKRLQSPLDTIAHFKKKQFRATYDAQKGFVIFQEYIECDHEWRCVVIGDSYFGHKKIRSIGEKISGSSFVSWDIPNARILNLIRQICETGNFRSVAIDIFEDKHTGGLFVNEIQCFFGSKNPHQMIRNGEPGRFIYKNNEWIYEPGIFNTNNSFDLRIDHLLSLMQKKVGQ